MIITIYYIVTGVQYHVIEFSKDVPEEGVYNDLIFLQRQDEGFSSL